LIGWSVAKRVHPADHRCSDSISPAYDRRSSDPHSFRGGRTLIIDLSKGQIQYAIVKNNIDSQNRADPDGRFSDGGAAGSSTAALARAR